MRRKSGQSRLFLVELIGALCLFAICAAVCAALLVHARSMSRESTRLTQAVYAAQSMAEAWKSGTTQTWREPGGDGLLGSLTVRDGKADITITTQEGAVVYTLEEVERLD